MRYFIHSEFDQKGLPGSGEKFMDRLFLSQLDALRHKCKFPFIINSGYRSPEYNNQISTTGFYGAHTTGKAADIAVERQNAYLLLQNALEMECFTGIGIKQHGDRRFIHLDTLTPDEALRPTIWSYN
ncbi:MAG: D-Ala-D-Ala carboxypeptidase family metallohydrolase [Candidatus Bathyarchaeia archaeon]